jgi:hypothetical protein
MAAEELVPDEEMPWGLLAKDERNGLPRQFGLLPGDNTFAVNHFGNGLLAGGRSPYKRRVA